MARKRRDTNVFSLSFLDCMSCGFGAVVLFFMIINHASEVRSDEINRDLLAEVDLVERQVLDGEKYLVELRNSLEEIDKEVVITEGLSKQVIREIDHTREELADMDHTTLAKVDHINKLKADIKALEEEKRRLEGARKDLEEEGVAIRSFVGQGDRQYLTGLKVGGKRILVLLDASASMLDQTIVNVIRRRNMAREQKLRSRKWQRAVTTVDWLTTQFPGQSKFQIYTFNVKVAPAIGDTLGEWIDVKDGRKLDEAVKELRQVVPENGTSMHRAILAARELRPLPDNIYLITDGLPTQAEKAPIRSTISGKRRVRLFEDAVGLLPPGIPVNVILFPMEGDPMASGSFWQLAQLTGGSFISPSKDWP